MARTPKITFIGAGSTTFMRKIVGDILSMEATSNAHFALLDINQTRLDESLVVFNRLAKAAGGTATVSTHLDDQKGALDGADFVIVAFQIGGYDPCTITDFEVPKEFGLRQTVADTLGLGGIMRGLRTVPHLWSICEDMMEVCPNAILLQYVNPMAINTWAIARRFPKIRQVGLCHSVQGTIKTLATDLGIPHENMVYQCAGINHFAFYLSLQEKRADGTMRDLYPVLKQGYEEGRYPTPESYERPRNPNIVRYEILKRFGYFVTESSEHFAEYVPWFIKSGRPDLIEKFGIPLDEYPVRCVEQIARWEKESSEMMSGEEIELMQSHEYASDIINSVLTGAPSVIYGNVPNAGLISNLPEGCAVEVPCLVDSSGLQPTHIGALPPQLAAMMQTNVNVQSLTVEALMTENTDHIYHAAMMDPHTAAELDLEQITQLVDKLRVAHGDWLPSWACLNG